MIQIIKFEGLQKWSKMEQGAEILIVIDANKSIFVQSPLITTHKGIWPKLLLRASFHNSLLVVLCHSIITRVWKAICLLRVIFSSPRVPTQAAWCAVSAAQWPITQETAAWRQAASSSLITSWSVAAMAAPKGTASSPPLSTWAGASCVPEVSF